VRRLRIQPLICLWLHSTCQPGLAGQLHDRSSRHQARSYLRIVHAQEHVAQVAAAVSSSGNKERVTVVLTVAADGTKYPPSIIIGRRKYVPKNLPKGLDAQVQVARSPLARNRFVGSLQSSGFMDERCMLEWIDTTFRKGPGAFDDDLILILDSHSAHHTEKVLKAFEEHKTHVVKVRRRQFRCNS